MMSAKYYIYVYIYLAKCGIKEYFRTKFNKSIHVDLTDIQYRSSNAGEGARLRAQPSKGIAVMWATNTATPVARGDNI